MNPQKSFLIDLTFERIFCYIDRKSFLINYRAEMVSSQTERDHVGFDGNGNDLLINMKNATISYILRNVGTFFFPNWTRHTKIQKVLDKTLLCVFVSKDIRNHIPRDVLYHWHERFIHAHWTRTYINWTGKLVDINPNVYTFQMRFRIG